MNVGALIVMIEWLKDIEIAGGPIGPPAPNGNGETYPIKPDCGLGEYAYQDPFTQVWSCVRIPGGR